MHFSMWDIWSMNISTSDKRWISFPQEHLPTSFQYVNLELCEAEPAIRAKVWSRFETWHMGTEIKPPNVSLTN